MNFFGKIKQFTRKKAEKKAKLEVAESLFDEEALYPHLKKLKERLAYKQNLTATYAYGSGEDKLSRKQDFIDQYTVNEREQFQYFIINNPFDCDNKAKTHAWRDHEQVERREAQKAWRVVQHRNHREHMRQKFMNQKTR